jgi:putative two-component system response regulator
MNARLLAHEAPPFAPTQSEGMEYDGGAQAQLERFAADFGRMYNERKKAMDELARAHVDALLRLAHAAELKDDDTGIHMVRIGILAEALALLLGHDRTYARQLRTAAPMHDVGKIGIPDTVLKKPGPLEADEWAVMRTHPKIGAEILGRSRTPVFQLAAEVALTHHERWDGSGYPNGFAGVAIPDSARIVAVVDFFDALTMNRVYRPAFSIWETLRMLAAERGKAFDPHVVDTFLGHAVALNRLRIDITAAQPGISILGEDDPFGLVHRLDLDRPRAYVAEDALLVGLGLPALEADTEIALC